MGKKRSKPIIFGSVPRNLKLLGAAIVSVFFFNAIYLSNNLPTPSNELLFLSRSSEQGDTQQLKPVERELVVDAEEPQQQQQQRNCPDYGCPIYPAEITDQLSQIIQSRFLYKNDTSSSNETLEFSNDKMAMLTQQGKSHIFNQDRAVLINPYTIDESSQETSFLIGLFDGHGRRGHLVADYVTKELPKLLAWKLRQFSEPADDQQIVQLLKETFVEVDRKIPADDALHGGCTGSVTYRRGSKLYIANVGDSQTILVSIIDTTNQLATTTIPFMTRKDKPTLPDEKARIEGLNGKIFINKQNGMARVNVYSKAAKEIIGLAMSRAIGDWEWKPIGVTAEPLVDIVDLSHKNFTKAYIMAASDGLWDVRRREFYANRFAECFHGGDVPPVLKLWDIIGKVTPTNPKWYRDDITGVILQID